MWLGSNTIRAERAGRISPDGKRQSGPLPFRNTGQTPGPGSAASPVADISAAQGIAHRRWVPVMAGDVKAGFLPHGGRTVLRKAGTPGHGNDARQLHDPAHSSTLD